MELVVGVLIIYGLAHAVRKSGGNLRAELGKRRTASRSAATKRGPHHDADAVRRRHARQATMAWWAGEIAHPSRSSLAHGFREGWAEHRHAMVQWEHDRAKRAASHAGQHATMREQIAAYKQRRWEAEHPEAATADPPLADGRTPGTPPPASGTGSGSPGGTTPGDPARNGSAPRNKWVVYRDGHPDEGPFTTAELVEHSTAGKGPFEVRVKPQHANGDSTMAATGTADFTLDAGIAEAEAAVQAADQIVNDQALAAADGLGDRVTAAFPNATRLPGLATDAEMEAQELRACAGRYQQAMQSLHGELLNYKAMQDSLNATDSTDVPAEGVLPG